MIKRKMVIILVGIAAGIVVISATLGGLAAEGAFGSTTQNNDVKKGGTEQQEKAHPNLLKGKIAIYKAFLQYAKDKTGIKRAEEEIESITASAIDSEINKLKNKLDGFYKFHLDKVLEEVKTTTKLTAEKLAEIQKKLEKYTAQFKEKIFANLRWYIYITFSKLDTREDDYYNVKSENEFRQLTPIAQYSEIDRMKNNIQYTSLESKVFNKTLKTIRNIEENVTNLNAEQKTLIQEWIKKRGEGDASFAFIKILTKHIREELYSFLIGKGLAKGLASLDEFKGFNRDNQFKELKKVKDIVAKRSFTGVNNPGTKYEKAINEYINKENNVYVNYSLGPPVQLYVRTLVDLVKWLKK